MPILEVVSRIDPHADLQGARRLYDHGWLNATEFAAIRRAIEQTCLQPSGDAIPASAPTALLPRESKRPRSATFELDGQTGGGGGGGGGGLTTSGVKGYRGPQRCSTCHALRKDHVCSGHACTSSQLCQQERLHPEEAAGGGSHGDDSATADENVRPVAPVVRKAVGRNQPAALKHDRDVHLTGVAAPMPFARAVTPPPTLGGNAFGRGGAGAVGGAGGGAPTSPDDMGCSLLFSPVPSKQIALATTPFWGAATSPHPFAAVASEAAAVAAELDEVPARAPAAVGGGGAALSIGGAPATGAPAVAGAAVATGGAGGSAVQPGGASASADAAQAIEAELLTALDLFVRRVRVPCPARVLGGNGTVVSIAGAAIEQSSLFLRLSDGSMQSAFQVELVGTSEAADFNRSLMRSYRSWVLFMHEQYGQ